MKYHKVIAEKGEFSAPEFPIMKGYKMACCDCGLVHDMEFFVFEVDKFLPDGYFEGKVKRGKKWRIGLKARRNNRATGQMRRHNGVDMKKKKPTRPGKC